MMAGVWLMLGFQMAAQTLINVDFGVGSRSAKVGFAATGQSTNDFWNLYRHYDPKYLSGTPLVTNGLLSEVKMADGSPTSVTIAVTNAPGVWGNATGDPMYDSYVFSRNGSNMTVTLRGFSAGRYHFYLYGHADPDVTGEQNSVFTLSTGTNTFGPLTTLASAGWKATISPWLERSQYIVFRDVPVVEGQSVLIEVAPGINGIAVLNGLQIISRGTSPPALETLGPTSPAAIFTNLMFRSIRYEGRVTDDEARFATVVDVESMTTNEISAPLFEGEVAVMASKIPPGLRLVSRGKEYRLYATAPGSYQLSLEILAKITRQEPWNQISFVGPAAAIASVTAQGKGQGMELQLLSGTQLEGEKPGRNQTNSAPPVTTDARVQGFLGADRLLSLRWQSKTTEVARKALLTVDTTARAQVTPTVIKFTTQFRYEILQAAVPRLTVALPTNQALTKLEGEQIRDWQVKPDGERQLLTVEFIKPVEKNHTLTLYSEQTVDATPLTVSLVPPQPLQIERESGSLAIFTEDASVEIESVAGLRQVNAAKDSLAAYRFYGRPFTLNARVQRMQPVVRATDRMTVRLEETRLLVSHSLSLGVEKAGIYSVELLPQSGLTVAEVRGDGVDDWKVSEGKLRVSFASRVMGSRQLEVQLEQPLKSFPEQIQLAPLRVTGATNESAQIGAAAAAGIQIKTGELTGVRETPIASLSRRTDELLAFATTKPDWRLTLTTERLAARIVAEVFNLVTIGDGLVGGSATVRYGIINQGVQEFRIKLPASWKNIDFTGANIRRKEQQADTWIIGLQDKVWGGYTLVITYDFPFDPKGATLAVGGAHALNVERETGTVVITTASGLQLKTRSAADPLRRVDELELAPADRALIARPVLLAYRYAGDRYDLTVDVTRFEAMAVLDAVADRTQLTTVLTDAGQMLTQASFMVKNNEKQFQRFHLPAGSEFWSCFVNNQPVKAERDGDWLLVPLPRGANRDEAFAVDMVYAQKTGAFRSWFPRSLALEAPRTDVPNTYAEWQLYAPATERLSGFGGNMTVARGTTYDWRDAWQRFLAFYHELLLELGSGLLVAGGGLVLVIALLAAARRRGFKGVATVVTVCVVLVVMAGMLLPALSRAKSKSIASQHKMALAQQSEDQRDESAMQQKPAAPAPAPALARRYGVVAGRAITAVDAVALPAEQVATNAPAAPAGEPMGDNAGAMTSGIRPIRIDIPRTGDAYTFTKVLNVGGEPLSVKARVMRLKAVLGMQMAFQVTAFLVGLLLWLWQRHVASPSSFRMTIAWALMLGAVGYWLTSQRLLHWGLIAGAPLASFALLVWICWRWWPRKTPATPMGRADGSASGGLPPVMTLIPFLLWASASANAATPAITNGFSILAAEYTGTIRERVGQFDAVIRLSAFVTNQVVRLFGEDVAIQQFSATPANVQLMRENGYVSVRLPDAGEATVQCRFLVKQTGTVSQRQLSFEIPPALASQLTATLDEADADVEFPTAVAFKRTSAGAQTRVEAVLGAGERVNLRWTPRVKRAAEIAATVFCQNTVLVSFGGGVIDTRATLEYQISQGELRQARVQVPAGQRLLRVEGESIRTWELNTNATGDITLTVELLKGVAPAYRLMIETEKLLETLPAKTRVETPHALDVKRETGLIALRGSEELGVVADSQDLQRVDAEEFVRIAGGDKTSIVSAFRFLKPEFDLTAAVETLQPQIEAVMRNNWHAGFDQVTLAAQVNYTIKRAGVFGLRLALPSVGYTITRVQGEKIMSWSERVEGPNRFLEVTLQERVLGAYKLQIDLRRLIDEVPKTMVVDGVHPLGTAKLTGYLSVASETGVAVKTDTFEGLTEIPVAILPNLGGPNPAANQAAPNPNVAPNPMGTGALAFKYIASEPVPSTLPWKLTLSVETVEPWLRAEVLDTVTLTETLASGRAQVRYEIANAPVKELRVQVPAVFRNVEMNGDSIRRRDREGETWRISLQNKIRGFYTLTITWDQPLDSKTNALEVLGVQALGVERETGTLAIVAKPPLQVTEKTAVDLQKLDVRELPEWAGAAPAATVLTYRYLRPGYRLFIESKRFEEAEVLQVLVDNAQLTTVVADDGQLMTQMTLAIRNNGRQHLEVELPPGATVWSAFVAGQPVRPSVREGRLLLPLERSGSDGAPVRLELTFVGTNLFPRVKGLVDLISAKIDVPLKNVRWELYLPPDYRYDKFGGTMTHQAGEAVAPAMLRYTQFEYTEQESRRKVAMKAGVESSLSSIKNNLRLLNVKEAVEDYNRAKIQANYEVSDKKDFREIEVQLRKAQSSNLIQSQNEFSYRNSAQVPERYGQQLAQQGGALGLNYDADVAERQYTKLQQAQEVAVTKVQPLHVNLPTRGLRYSFTQVLQTELRQPMTIHLTATNNKTTGWGMRLLVGLAGFVALWIVVAAAGRNREKSNAI
jgi:hypothetical protein